ncbi:MAG: hypothetical protein H0W94_03745 [Actinobacteria bacterium]|nr:hypothetical protein [Actinomycetota bacterium]
MRTGPANPERGVFRGRMARRLALLAAALLVPTGLAACESGDASPEGPGASRSSAGQSPPSASVSTSPSGPTPSSSPASIAPSEAIEHVVFIVKENRSFDHYFGRYPGADGATSGETFEGETIPLRDAPDVEPHDIAHGFSSALQSINDGRMNGFSIIGGNEELNGYRQHSRRTMPNYWAYADRFVLADQFFTSMYGATYPEHLYVAAAQSYKIIDNKTSTDSAGNYCDDPTEYSTRFRDGLTAGDVDRILFLQDKINEPGMREELTGYWEAIRLCFDIQVLPDVLERAGIGWKYYVTADRWMNVLQSIRHVRYGPMWSKVQHPSNFLTDVRSRQLPAVSWLIPPEPYNEHPGAGVSVCAGENWTVQQVNAVMRSPYWQSTLIVVVWDDFGGYYDHVRPPRYDIMGPGPRTPALIISPWTQSGDSPDGGSIDSTTYEFSSVLRLIEDLHGLEPMTERDRQADPLTGALDFTSPPRMEKLILQPRKDCPYGTDLT